MVSVIHQKGCIKNGAIKDKDAVVAEIAAVFERFL